MIDDDDATFAILAWMPGGGWFATILGAVIVVVTLIVVARNHRECEAKRCDRGKPVLAHHECLCVELAE